jgi:heme-degrading monooxygenase HmoA
MARTRIMTHVRIWKFLPRAEREAEFARAYGSAGEWARLFSSAPGYIGTELLAPREPGGWWMTIDRWRSIEDFEAFQGHHGEAYRRLDAELEDVAGEEQFVGTFETAQSQR